MQVPIRRQAHNAALPGLWFQSVRGAEGIPHIVVVVRVVVECLVLEDPGQEEAEILRGLYEDRKASPVSRQCVRVGEPEHRVVENTSRAPVVADRANSRDTVHEGSIHHGGAIPIRIAAIHGGALALEIHLPGIQLGLARDQPDRTRLGASAVQGALGDRAAPRPAPCLPRQS